jgi:hypothetical protein
MRLLGVTLLLIALLISALEWHDQTCAQLVLTFMSKAPSSHDVMRLKLLSPHISLPYRGESVTQWSYRHHFEWVRIKHCNPYSHQISFLVRIGKKDIVIENK